VKEIKFAYYAYMQSREAITILESAVSLAKENLRFNQVLVKNDKAIRTVVSRSENELIGLEARLEDAKNQSVNAAGYFNFLLNTPLDSPIEGQAAAQLAPFEPDTAATGRREELVKLESLLKINTLSGQLAKASSLPKLSTFMDLGTQGDFIKFNNDTRYYLFGVTLDWRVFAANRVQYKTKQAAMDRNATSAAAEPGGATAGITVSNGCEQTEICGDHLPGFHQSDCTFETVLRGSAEIVPRRPVALH
jgi:outer membrane protein TolC